MKQAQKKKPVAKPAAKPAHGPAKKRQAPQAPGKQGAAAKAPGAKPHAAGGHAAKPVFIPDTIAQGSSSTEVRMLQILLEKNGFDVGPVDGIFGPMTHGAVIKFQMKKGLGVDGIVGPKTWGELRAAHPDKGAEKKAGIKPKHKEQAAKRQGEGKADKPKSNIKKAPAAAKGGGKADKPKAKGDHAKDAEARKDILAIAGSQLGTKETGYNGGGARKYQQFFGRGPEPWCADFVSWVFTKAGIKTNSPYCPTFIQQLKKQGRWKGKRNPQAGDIVFFDWERDGKSDHVGIVKHVNNDGSITTIEGNTGKPGGGPEGVWQKQRYNITIAGYGSVS